MNGWENLSRLTRPHLSPILDASYAADRVARESGKGVATLAVVDADPQKPAAMPGPDSFAFFSAWQEKSTWTNIVTVKILQLLRSYDLQSCMDRISPTPVLMVIASHDADCPQTSP